jgi:uncharacterized protein involved in propanediol utilization
MDETDGDGVEEVQLFPAMAPAHDKSRVLEQSKMLRDGDSRHVVAGSKSYQGLAVLFEQCVEKGSPSRIGKRSKHCLHNNQNRKPNGFLSRVEGLQGAF